MEGKCEWRWSIGGVDVEAEQRRWWVVWRWSKNAMTACPLCVVFESGWSEVVRAAPHTGMWRVGLWCVGQWCVDCGAVVCGR